MLSRWDQKGEAQLRMEEGRLASKEEKQVNFKKQGGKTGKLDNIFGKLVQQGRATGKPTCQFLFLASLNS